MNRSIHTIGTCCEFIKNELIGLYPEREIHSLTDLILFHVLGIPKHEIHLEKDTIIEDSQNKQIDSIVKELSLQKPIQYILGYTDFFGSQILVSPDVLIPRPETEELVKWIIDDHMGKLPEILDIGTGSGCIAIALKKNIPQSRVYACDVTDAALEMARKNAKLNRTDIVFFILDIITDSPSTHKIKSVDHSSVLNSHQKKHLLYDIIASNPPYIPLKEKRLMSITVSSYEPEHALFVPDDDPLIFYRNIASFGLEYLKNNGMMYFEIHERSGHEVSALLEEFGYRDITVRMDINGKNRMIRCTKYNE